jgi:hypothetical protein
MQQEPSIVVEAVFSRWQTQRQRYGNEPSPSAHPGLLKHCAEAQICRYFDKPVGFLQVRPFDIFPA